MTRDKTESSGFSDSDELLDRAVTTLRDMAVPPGPSTRLMERTLENLGRHTHTELTPPPRFVLRRAILAIAAAMAILCASVVVYRMAFHRQGAPVVKSKGESMPGLAVPSPAPVSPDHSHIETPGGPQIVKAPTPAPMQVAFAPGVITGRVLFDGVPPTRVQLAGANLMPECQKAHGGPIYDESLVVNPDGTLANVVVSVSSGLSGWLREEFPPTAAPAVLDQKGCVFEPHVVALMVGEPLQIKNSDPFLHNVHILAVNNFEANVGQPTVGEMATQPFESPEVFRVKCDVHPWMQAWVRVLDNPYFSVTGRDGRFTLQGLPPGTYTLKAWHEQLGVREMQVTISPDHGSALDFTFKPVQ